MLTLLVGIDTVNPVFGHLFVQKKVTCGALGTTVHNEKMKREGMRFVSFRLVPKRFVSFRFVSHAEN